MKFIESFDGGQESRVELIEVGPPQICEGWGEEVTTYLITAEEDDDALQIAECLVCALKSTLSIRPAEPAVTCHGSVGPK